jgi:hypothetical protein
LAALGVGLGWSVRRGERAIPAALGAAAVLWLYSLIDGTPYQEAKALVLAAPLVAVVSVRALVSAAPAALAAVFLAAAGGSGLLALVNGPVGPGDYSRSLAELRPTLGAGSVLVLAPEEVVANEHGRDYLVWELRGNRICVGARTELAAQVLPGGPVELERIAQVLIVEDVGATSGAPALPAAPEGFLLAREGPGYLLYDGLGSAGDPGPCPFISDGQRADPSAD